MNRTLDRSKEYVSLNKPHILEFGVCNGKSLRQIRKLFPGHRLFGFDTFTGLPQDWTGTKHVKGDMSTGGKMPNDIENCIFYKGLFSDTIPQYLSKYSGQDIALIHIDCDLYTSTQSVLFGLDKQIKKGTVLVFDEWFYNHSKKYNDHEQKAFYEWAETTNRSFQLIARIDDDYDEMERQIVVIK